MKIYDVQAVAQICSYAEFLASMVGTYVGVDEAILCGSDKTLCFQVDVDVLYDEG